jgi:AraC-like DNA-binding protein
MEESLNDSDANLHSVMRGYAEQLLEGLPHGPNFTATVREVVARHLASGQLGIELVARELHMSTRTLGRRLDGEGTNFTDLVDDIRKRLALRHVGNRSFPLAEVAFMLGFAHPAAFHRAFKRWSGTTPLRYRNQIIP